MAKHQKTQFLELVFTLKIVFLFRAYLGIIRGLSANTRRKKAVFTTRKS